MASQVLFLLEVYCYSLTLPGRGEQFLCKDCCYLLLGLDSQRITIIKADVMCL